MIDLPTPDPTIEIVAATRGTTKGLAHTDGPQLLVRGEVAFGHAYVGAYGKNVTLSGDDGVEAAALLGLKFNISGFDLSASAGYKALEGIAPPVDADALEFSGSASRQFGAVTARAVVIYSPDDLTTTRQSTFYEAGLSFAPRTGTTLSAALGRRERTGAPDYTAFNAGLSQTIYRNLTADLRYYDTAQSSLGDVYRGRFVASVHARF